MTEGNKQGGKGKAPVPAPAVEQKSVGTETRYSAAEHLANAKAAYGSSTPLVAAGIAVLEANGVNPEGYTKAEVRAAVNTAKNTEIKEG